MTKRRGASGSRLLLRRTLVEISELRVGDLTASRGVVRNTDGGADAEALDEFDVRSGDNQVVRGNSTRYSLQEKESSFSEKNKFFLGFGVANPLSRHKMQRNSRGINEASFRLHRFISGSEQRGQGKRAPFVLPRNLLLHT